MSERGKRSGIWHHAALWLSIWYLAVQLGCVRRDVTEIKKALNIPAEPEKDETK